MDFNTLGLIMYLIIKITAKTKYKPKVNAGNEDKNPEKSLLKTAKPKSDKMILVV